VERGSSLQHLQRHAFWHRAADRRDSQRTLAGALDCYIPDRPFWSRGGELRPHHALGGAPPAGGLLVGYQLVLSDWLWYTLLPLISYIALVVAAILLSIYPGPALFVIAAVTMLLLFIGIRNAWDVVTYVAIERSQPQNTSQD
jgi:hypothetical protein